MNINIEHINIHFVAENALLLTWDEIICAEQHKEILALEKTIKQEFSPLILESISSYSSLIIYYDFQQIRSKRLIKRLTDLINNLITNQKSNLKNQYVISAKEASAINIPVYYGEDAGWDLTALAQQTQLSIDEIITLHSQQSYRAYALGFTPGFCYLASLNEKLSVPRKATPRTSVPKGAVAIAELQTAIYPNESPGGWHIIGQTPMPMFSFCNGEFVPKISVGDTVTYSPIDKKEFLALGGELAIET